MKPKVESVATVVHVRVVAVIYEVAGAAAVAGAAVVAGAADRRGACGVDGDAHNRLWRRKGRIGLVEREATRRRVH